MKTLVTNNIESNSLVLTINVGDRVKVKSQDTPADVTAISEDGKYYTVKFASPVRSFWTDEMMTTSVYSRYGITRNYDRITGDIIECNAMYYAEELKFGPGSIIEYEFNGVALRVESTREDVEPDNREGWGDKWRVIHHKTGQTIDTMTLSEVAELLAQLYSKSHAPETKHTNNKNLTFQIGDRVERIGTGAAGTIDDVNNYEEQLTYIVKYDETQRRPSDGFEYLTEEVFENEIEPAPVLYGSRPIEAVHTIREVHTQLCNLM